MRSTVEGRRVRRADVREILMGLLKPSFRGYRQPKPEEMKFDA